MARQNIREESVNRISSGYEGDNIPDNFKISACTIEDVDRAVFRLFDTGMSHPLFVGQQQNTKKVPVIFATGERFALVKRKIPIRDKNNALILPLVSVRRTAVDMVLPSEYGLPGATGPLTIKRKLSTKDPKYQSVVNRLRLQSQRNVASRANFADASLKRGGKPGRVASRRNSRPSPADRQDFMSGRLLKANLGNNIFETITIPFPKFYKTTYEITYWTQYTTHMNQMIENTVSSVETQGKNFKVTTDKGYWFVVHLEESFSPGDNFDDFSSDERIIKYSFNVHVYSYFLANQNPGQLSPFRYKLSAPQINFGVFAITAPVSIPGALTSDVGTGDINKFILGDIEVLDNKGDKIESNSQVVENVVQTIADPFGDGTIQREVKIVTRNQRQGETVMRSRIVRKIDDFNL
jgi:hypothetical protein